MYIVVVFTGFGRKVEQTLVLKSMTCGKGGIFFLHMELVLHFIKKNGNKNRKQILKHMN